MAKELLLLLLMSQWMPCAYNDLQNASSKEVVTGTDDKVKTRLRNCDKRRVI